MDGVREADLCGACGGVVGSISKKVVALRELLSGALVNRSRLVLLVAMTLSLNAGDLSGIVQGPDGKPIPRAVVAATPELPNALSDAQHAARVTHTDEQGHFLLQDLPAGAYGATATAAGVGSAFLGKLAVPAQGSIRDLVFNLSPGSTFEGKLLIQGGTQLEGVQVFAVRVSHDAGDIFYGLVEGGRYRLSLAPGVYILLASSSGYEASPVSVHVPGMPSTQDLHLYPEKGSEPTLSDELVTMAAADQEIRTRVNQHPDDKTLMATWGKEDAQREARLIEIVKIFGWPTLHLVGSRGASAAWLLTQHASAPFLKACLPAMKQAAERGELPWGDVALSIDRDRIYDGMKQIYGSQFRRNSKGEWEEYPIEDVAHVDERRRAMGLQPFAENKAGILQKYASSAKAK